MREFKGKVGNWEMSWKTTPHSSTGVTCVEVAGQLLNLRWHCDLYGIWIELPDGVHGFDMELELSDFREVHYHVTQRGKFASWQELRFLRSNEQTPALLGTGLKRGMRVRAQMPGKIIRMMVSVGDVVKKDQSLFVMEAMKMENEIRAPQAGKLTSIFVVEGQAVETGVNLCVIDSE